MTTPSTILVIFECNSQSDCWLKYHFESHTRTGGFPAYFENRIGLLKTPTFVENILQNNKTPNVFLRMIGHGMRSIFDDITKRAYEFIRSNYAPGDMIFLLGEDRWGDRALVQLCQYIYSNSTSDGLLIPLKESRTESRVPGTVPVKCVTVLGCPHTLDASTTERIIQKFPPIIEHFLYYASISNTRESHAIHYDPKNRVILSREIMIFDPIPVGAEYELCMQWIKFYTHQFANYYYQAFPNTFTHATMLWRVQVVGNEDTETSSAPQPYGLARCSVRAYSGLVQASRPVWDGGDAVVRVKYIVWYGRRG